MQSHYFRVFWTFLRNSLIRELSMRGNFWIQVVTEGIWFVSQIFLFQVIFAKVPEINTWTRYEFFAFMATSMIINTLTEALFLPNCASFSEAIRTASSRSNSPIGSTKSALTPPAAAPTNHTNHCPHFQSHGSP